MAAVIFTHSHVDHFGGGLGLTTAAGTITLFEPNKIIKKTGEKLTVDGVDIAFTR